MTDYSQAIELIKKVLFQHINAKALMVSNEWSIEFDQDGIIDAPMAIFRLEAKSFKGLIKKYYDWIERKNLNVIDVYLKNFKYFPETYLDVTHKEQIKKIRMYLSEAYPEKLL